MLCRAPGCFGFTRYCKLQAGECPDLTFEESRYWAASGTCRTLRSVTHCSFRRRFEFQPVASRLKRISTSSGNIPVLDNMADEGKTLEQLLRTSAEKFGNGTAVAVTEGGPKVTHAELLAAVESTAAKLLQAGVKPGELVSLTFANTFEFVITFLAVTRARAVAAPLNAGYTEEEFKFYIEDAGGSLLLVPSEGNKAAEAAAEALGLPVAGISWDEGQRVLNLEARARLTLGAADADPGPVPLPSDTALFLHTSGTTSRPKGVPLTHANLTASISNIIATYELSPTDTTLIVMPLFHVHGLMAALLSTLAAGGAAWLPGPGRFSATTFWKDIQEAGATWYTAVPTIHQILLSRHKSAPEESYPSLRFIRSCSSSLAPAVLANLEETFHAPVLEAYAMTEASHQMTSNPLPSHGPHKPGSVGVATGIQLAVLDDKNEPVPTGQVGEVCIKGPNVTLGYKNNDAANEVAFAGGWFHTGDRGILDAEGFLTLTGRIKELINRGGEKISPMEVDAALLAHPAVAEAVAFGAPDEKYGEEVNAAVVLHPGATATEADIQTHVKGLLSGFKVPKRVFLASAVPRTATGKIQRRFVAEHFLKGPPAEAGAAGAAAEGAAGAAGGAAGSSGDVDGNVVVARALARLGVRYMFGVVGIPVTAVATAAQAAGVRYIGMHNEQSAGYAAGAAGYLTGVPGALLTVSGPGAVHGLAGLSGATINCWPMIMISGSSDQSTRGLGDFQELDQVPVVAPHTKFSGGAADIREVPGVLQKAVAASVAGRPGGVYVDLPTDVLHQHISEAELEGLLGGLVPVAPVWEQVGLPGPSEADLAAAVEALRGAERPLVVVGKGAGYARAEGELRKFVEATGIPFVPTPMAKGILPDSHPLSAGAARSTALAEADVVLVVGARLNWILHFGKPPKWSPNVKFILLEVDPSEVALRKPFLGLVGDARATLEKLNAGVAGGAVRLEEGHPWRAKLGAKVAANAAKMAAALAKDVVPLNFHCSLRVIRDALEVSRGTGPAPILVSEGANTMDVGRTVFEQVEPRTRLDAGTWGTMGVGLGYVVAAAVACPERLVVAVEGDSAFGFSGMEVEVLVRYNLPVVVIIMNNGGVYGGDRRTGAKEDLQGPFGADPAPTAFVPGIRYDLLMQAFQGKGYIVETPQELQAACTEAFAARKPALINVIIDPLAGGESGRLHGLN